MLPLALALLLAAATAGPAAAQGFGRNKVQTTDHRWKTLHTPHFDILHYAGAEELAVRASLIAERAYREYADRLGRELPWRVPFVLYASHRDFAQTNIADWLIGEGTGGFSEPFRNRMVLPYNGSHADFVHVIRHELVHVFMFDMAYGGAGEVGRRIFFGIPLWFAEGFAEWFSVGWDAEADMVVRDAVITGYLQPLADVGGFLAYKEGQAAVRMLAEDYGPETLVEFWRDIGRSHSVDGSLRRVYGLSPAELDRQFARSLRKRYWPDYADLEEADQIARRLTDHRREQAFANGRPAVSPDGRRVAFFSDRDGLNSLYLLSAIDGRVLRRLVQGSRGSRFESLHGYRSGIGFSPDGREIAFVALSGNEETLHTVDVESGDLTRSLRLGLDVAASPAWSPDGRSLALVGTRNGRTDLYLLLLDPAAGPEPPPGPSRRLAGGQLLVRLTDDVGDEGAPAWSPDGRTLAFGFDPRAEIDFEFALEADGRRRLLWARPRPEAGGGRDEGSLVLLEPWAGQRWTLAGDGARREPVWVGPRSLCVVDEGIGIANLALVELDSSGTAVAGERRLTNVLGGLARPAYAPGADRLVFAAFQEAGWDLFAVEGFVARWSRRRPGGRPPRPDAGAPARAGPEAAPPEGAGIAAGGPPAAATAVADTAGTGAGGNLVAAGEPAAAPEVGLIEDYRPSFQVDVSEALAGGGVYFNSAGGLGMANTITLSDVLGDHRLRFLVNFYGSFANSDLAASYYYLKRRIDLGVGVFHYHNYYNTSFTSLGELLPDDALFAERNYGVFGLAAYPLSTFERFELELQALTSERTTYEPDPSGLYLRPGEERLSRLLRPGLTFVRDTSYWGPFGPVTGSRLSLSYSHAVSVGGSSLSRRTVAWDLRDYWLPWRRNSFAARLAGAASLGDDPRAFVLGGPFTLRGYDFYDYRRVPGLSGTRFLLLDLEYRLPLLDYLVFGWPLRWGLTGIGATLFFDAGAAWQGDLRPFGRDADGRWGLRDLRGDYGIGLRTRIGFLPLRFDWAWPTDLRRTGRPVFHFSIGPDF